MVHVRVKGKMKNIPDGVLCAWCFNVVLLNEAVFAMDGSACCTKHCQIKVNEVVTEAA